MRRFILPITVIVMLAAALPAAASQWDAYYDAAPVEGTTTFAMTPGETKEITLSFKNEGEYRWRGGASGWRYVSLYATSPYARSSAFRTPSWTSSVQPAILSEERVEPGEQGTFTFTLQAPTTPGTYTERFALAAEDTAWVKDGEVVLTITVDQNAGLEEARRRLSQVLATRADLQKYFAASDWRSLGYAQTGDIKDLEDWARRYGYKEHPDQLLWYSPSRPAPAPTPVNVTVPPALAPVAAAPIHDGIAVPNSLITADKYIVIDDASRRVLAEFRADDDHPIASITKLMTSMITIESGAPMWKTIPILDEDEVGGARLRVSAGSSLTTSDMMYAALVGSANNAAHALVHATGWPLPDFVAKMNTRAKELGLEETRFEDPTGIELGNISNARDVAAMLIEALDRHWAIRRMTTTQTIPLQVANATHTITNTNTLLTDNSNGYVVLGGKTGYLIESKWNLALRIMDARKRPLDIVVLGADTRDASMKDAEILARWAWDHHQW
jgi:D-alanyl-D-alanine endopeptidase (penicillin-binding protein 7)